VLDSRRSSLPAVHLIQPPVGQTRNENVDFVEEEEAGSNHVLDPQDIIADPTSCIFFLLLLNSCLNIIADFVALCLYVTLGLSMHKGKLLRGSLV
jgi:hypothetical protein